MWYVLLLKSGVPPRSVTLVVVQGTVTFFHSGWDIMTYPIHLIGPLENLPRSLNFHANFLHPLVHMCLNKSIGMMSSIQWANVISPVMVTCRIYYDRDQKSWYSPEVR